MNGLGEIKNRFFAILCFVVSALILIAGVACRIVLMWTEENVRNLESEISISCREAEILKVRFENQISLDELEKLVTEKFSMHKPCSTQICFIELG